MLVSAPFIPFSISLAQCCTISTFTSSKAPKKLRSRIQIFLPPANTCSPFYFQGTYRPNITHKIAKISIFQTQPINQILNEIPESPSPTILRQQPTARINTHSIRPLNNAIHQHNLSTPSKPFPRRLHRPNRPKIKAIQRARGCRPRSAISLRAARRLYFRWRRARATQIALFIHLGPGATGASARALSKLARSSVIGSRCSAAHRSRAESSLCGRFRC